MESPYGRHQNTKKKKTKNDKMARECRGLPAVYNKTFICIRNNSWVSSPAGPLTLTCSRGVTDLQNLTNLQLSSFAEIH